MKYLATFFTTAVIVTVLAPATPADTSPEARSMTARRIDSEPPRIDGRLDDAVWQQSAPADGFLQYEPVEGEAATEKTTVRIVYDEEAVYFGVRCYDLDPEGIVSRLTRRDGETEADWVSISIDPHLDHQTGRFFTVYASGAVRDGVYTNDRSRDDTWDSVWEVETSIDAEGWSAEFRIPYYVLRFSPKGEYVWGFNVERHVSRKQERTHWNLMRKRDPGLVSQFGHLEGIHDIKPPIGVEYLPYAMGRSIVDGETDYFGNVGVDVRYGVTSSLSLNATVNPDFGQVEADPAQLNLTAFEDFFREQRPFFVEGASIFQTSDYDLFYSRRIGRQPGYFSLPDEAVELDRPEATTILGAFKLTGKMGKTAFGLLQATTSSEHADIEQVNGGVFTKDEYRVEPLTNYLVGRARQDVLDGNSTVGMFASAVHRRGGHNAYVGAADWDLKFRENTYNITGTAVGSRAGEEGARKSGYIAHLEFDKRGGWDAQFYVHPDWRRTDGGRSYYRGLRSGVEWRPLPSVEFSIEPRYERRVTDAQWVDVFEDADGTHFVYGTLESRTLDLTTRAELGFRPGLSLELFLQPFIAIGDFSDFKELTAPERYDFLPYELDENRDFHRRSLKSNLVLRWEFSPGSTLFVVWSQSRRAHLDDPAGDDLEFRPFDRLGRSFTDEGDNVFLVKASYWVGG